MADCTPDEARRARVGRRRPGSGGEGRPTAVADAHYCPGSGARGVLRLAHQIHGRLAPAAPEGDAEGHESLQLRDAPGMCPACVTQRWPALPRSSLAAAHRGTLGCQPRNAQPKGVTP